MKKRVKALILFRALFVTLFLSSTYFFNVFEQFPANRAFTYLIFAFYSTSLGYFLLFNKIQNLQAFAYVQLVLDVFFEIVLIYLTGGIDSWFSYTVILTILSSSIVLNQKAGYIIATISSLLYGSLIVLQFHGILPIITEYQEAGNYLYNIFIHISSFYLIAFLSGYLSSRLEQTKEKLAEKDLNLRSLEFFNREVVESLPSGLLTTDMSGKILLFNRSAERITGLQRDDVVGKGVDLILPLLRFPFTEGRTEEVLTVNGARKIVGMGISMFSGGEENTKGYIVIFQDLTEWKKLETEMKKKEKWAAIGELSSNIAHEIRNPLASLKSSIEILKEDTVPATYKNRLMDIALKEMDRLDRIIKDFLTYSRPLPPSYIRFDLHELLDETVDLLQNVDQHRDTISIKKQYKGECVAYADPQKMRQVFWNLGLNALDAMPEGGELVISTDQGNNATVVTFEDTGTGIEENQLEKIFYPFFTTKDQGTGLGLAIAYRIMEEHGGTITVSSIPGTGTTFKVILRGTDERT